MSTALTFSLRGGLIFLLLMPLVIVPDIMAITAKALYARALVEIITALWVVGLIWKLAPRPPRSWVLLAFAAYVAIAMVSANWGVSFTKSIWSDYARMMGVWDLFHWFMIVAVAASVVGSPREWRSFINCSLIVGLILSLMALLQAYLPFILGLEALTVCRTPAVLMHPSTLAAILVVTTLLAVGSLVQSFIRSESPSVGAFNDCSALTQGMVQSSEEKRNLVAWRVFWSVVVALGMWALLLTGTRGALLGLVGGAITMPVALLIWGNRDALRPIVLAAGIIISAVLFLFLLDLSMGLHIASQCKQGSADKLISTTLEEQSVAERLISVKAGMKAFMDRPFLGWGPENYGAAFERFVDPVFFRRNDGIFDRAHNKMVGELATKGALGAIAYLVLWGAMVWTILRRRRPPREEILAYTVLGALAGYFIQNLFYFDTPATMLQLTLLIAWVASQEGAREDQEHYQFYHSSRG